jgi:hypothetical protein
MRTNEEIEDLMMGTLGTWRSGTALGWRIWEVRESVFGV